MPFRLRVPLVIVTVLLRLSRCLTCTGSTTGSPADTRRVSIVFISEKKASSNGHFTAVFWRRTVQVPTGHSGTVLHQHSLLTLSCLVFELGNSHRKVPSGIFRQERRRAQPDVNGLKRRDSASSSMRGRKRTRHHANASPIDKVVEFLADRRLFFSSCRDARS